MNLQDYAKISFAREIARQADIEIRDAQPSLYAELLTHAPQWPLYEPALIPDELWTRWQVALRVQIDAIIKRIVAPATHLTPAEPKQTQKTTPKKDAL